MKFVRVLSRIAILLLAAAALVGLTEAYGALVRPPIPGPSMQEYRRSHPSAPDLSKLLGDPLENVMVIAIYACAGRIVFGLRLSPVSRDVERLTQLNLRQQGGKTTANGSESKRTSS